MIVYVHLAAVASAIMAMIARSDLDWSCRSAMRDVEEPGGEREGRTAGR
jgi:hypothetical protein